MTDAAKAYFAELNKLVAKLADAHVLSFPLDTDVAYFLPVGDSVEVYWEAGGEPPHLRKTLPLTKARAYYRELLNDGFEAR